MALSRDARRKCRKITLIVTFALLVCGAVLMLVGGIRMFRVPFDAAKSDGLSDPRGPLAGFIACDQESERFAAFGKGLQKLSNIRCIVRQAPYAFVFVITATFLLVTGLIALISTLRGLQGSLFAFPTMAAVTLVLMLLSIYAFLQVVKPLTQLVPCEGLTAQQVAALTKLRFGTCVSNPDGQKKSSAYGLFDMLLVWAVGWILSFITLCVLIGLMGGVASRMMDHADALDDEAPSFTSAAVHHLPPTTIPGVEMYRTGPATRAPASGSEPLPQPQYPQYQYPAAPKYAQPQSQPQPSPQQLYYPYQEAPPRAQQTRYEEYPLR